MANNEVAMVDNPIGDLNANKVLDILGADNDNAPEPETALAIPEDKEELIVPGDGSEAIDDTIELQGMEDADEPIDKLDALDTYHRVPSRKEVLEKFPDLYKTFPGLEKAVYKEIKYSEIFPTVIEAKNAAAALRDYIGFENSLRSGDSELLFNALKKTDAGAFNKFTDNMLGTLSKVDKEAYNGVLNNVLKSYLYSAFEWGKKNGDEQLQIASQLLHRLTYGSANIEPLPEKKQETIDPREQEIIRKQQEFNAIQLRNAEQDVNSRAHNTIRATIDKYIDPRNSMSPYVREKAMEDAHMAVNNVLMNDTQFRAFLDRLWQKSQQEGYSQQTRDKIKEALTARAQSVLGAIIKDVRNKAIKNSPARKAAENEAPLSRQRASVRNNDGGGNDRPTKPSPDEKASWRNKSTLDILNSD